MLLKASFSAAGCAAAPVPAAGGSRVRGARRRVMEKGGGKKKIPSLFCVVLNIPSCFPELLPGPRTVLWGVCVCVRPSPRFSFFNIAAIPPF